MVKFISVDMAGQMSKTALGQSTLNDYRFLYILVHDTACEKKSI